MALRFLAALFLLSTPLAAGGKFNVTADGQAYGGWSAYAMGQGNYVDVDPTRFKVIGGKAYLFYNGLLGNNLNKWNKDEARLKAAADAHWKKLTETKLP